MKCEGCRMFGECDMHNMNSNYIKDCPCGTCPVNMICNHVCVAYLKLMHTIYNDHQFVADMKEHQRNMLVSQNKNILRE